VSFHPGAFSQTLQNWEVCPQNGRQVCTGLASFLFHYELERRKSRGVFLLPEQGDHRAAKGQKHGESPYAQKIKLIFSENSCRKACRNPGIVAAQGDIKAGEKI
jgi:hypothetical protein